MRYVWLGVAALLMGAVTVFEMLDEPGAVAQNALTSAMVAQN